MSILTRYLIQRNLFLLFSLLSVGTGLYLLSDLSHRIDTFLNAGQGASFIFMYFLRKTPLIISQILPAVFLISLIIQLHIMDKNREMIALQAGGISPLHLLRFILIYGIIWSCAQFGFAQVIGVYGEQVSTEMWQKEVRGRDRSNIAITGLWFTQDNYVVHLGKAWPNHEKAENVHIYELSPDGLEIEKTLLAERAESGKTGWTLYNVESITPKIFSYQQDEVLILPLKQQLVTFKTFETRRNPSEIDLPTLRKTIKRLKESGTNVEALRTNLHTRFSYSASILIMGLLALGITIRISNIYGAVIIALVITFIFYASSTFFSTMGEQGSLAPPVAAWLSNIIFFIISLIYIIMHSIRENKT